MKSSVPHYHFRLLFLMKRCTASTLTLAGIKASCTRRIWIWVAFRRGYFSFRRQISSTAVSGSARGTPLSERVFGRRAWLYSWREETDFSGWASSFRLSVITTVYRHSGLYCVAEKARRRPAGLTARHWRKGYGYFAQNNKLAFPNRLVSMMKLE